MLKSVLSIFAVVLISFTSVAQVKETTKADDAFTKEAYSDAVKLYKEAFLVEINSNQKARIIFQIAESYRYMNKISDAKSWYLKSIRAKHNNPLHFLYYGKCLMQEGKYDEAIEQFEKAKQQDPKLARDADNLIEGSKQAPKWKGEPTRYQVNNETIISSEAADFAPAFIDKKNSILLFTSSREGSTGKNLDVRTGENFHDLWMATRDRKGNWGEPVLFAAEGINTEASEGSAQINNKKNTLYFTRCIPQKDGTTPCDIYSANYVGGRASNIVALGLKAEGDNASIGQPSLNKKDNVLVFSSDMEGGQGGQDLWAITYDKKAKTWSTAKNLGPKVNTAGDEMFPNIHNDGRLFFASDGHPGLGGLDLFVSQFLGEAETDARWGEPENLQIPLNSERDDYAIIFNKSKNQGFFSSNRKNPMARGSDDLYSFYYPPLKFILTGTVYQTDNNKPIEGVTLEITSSEGDMKQVTTAADGIYNFDGSDMQRDIEEGMSYSIIVKKKDYLIAKDKISTVGLTESTTFSKDFFLTYTPPNKTIELPEINYELGSWELLAGAEDSLDFLFQILVDNETINIELIAHTDARGDQESNLELSQKRAQSCVDYLIGKGISAERMVPKGMGEGQPRVPEAQIDEMQDEAEKEEAHAKNRRTEFAIIGLSASKPKPRPTSPAGK